MPGYSADPKKKKRRSRLLKNAGRSHFLRTDGRACLPIFMRPINIFSGISTIPRPRSYTELNKMMLKMKNSQKFFLYLWLCKVSERTTSSSFPIRSSDLEKRVVITSSIRLTITSPCRPESQLLVK